MLSALQQYLFGGQVGLQEKKRLAAMLARLGPHGASADGVGELLPAWYPQLRELLVRHLRRPAVINDELRYAEWAAEAQLGKERATAAEAALRRVRFSSHSRGAQSRLPRLRPDSVRSARSRYRLRQVGPRRTIRK